MVHILTADDEPHLLELTKIYLEKTGDFTVDTAESAREALKMMETTTYDAIVSDYQMLEMDGIGFLKTVRGSGSHIPFIIFTGKGREDVVIKAINEGADFYLQKGGQPKAQFAELSHKIRQAVSSKQAEEALRESEEKYRLLVEKANEAILIAQDGVIRFANPRVSAMLGVPEEDLIGSPFINYVYEKDRELVLTRHEKRIAGENVPDAYDFRIIGDGGRIIWAFVSAAQIQWQGRPATITLLTDITNRKRADEALQRSESLYRTLFESTSAPTVIFGEDTIVLQANSALENLSGFSREELEGKKSWTEFVVKEDLERMREYHRLRRSDPGGAPRNYEFRAIDKSGNLHDIYLTTVMIPGTKKSVASMLDITDRKAAEQALQESEEKYRALAENSPDTIMRFDRHCRHLYVNAVVEQQTGIPAEQFIGKTHTELGFPKDLVELWEGAIQEVFATGKKNRIEFKLPSGIWIDWLLVPEFSPDGEVEVVVATSRDITDRKAAESALFLTNKKLQLLSGITRHDILNQITALAGYTDLLGEVLPDDPEMRNYIDRITKATSAVEKQITFTRDYEHLGMNPSKWQHVGDAAGRAASGCADYNVSVSTDTGALEVFADPMLGMVFFNLFDNAIRHGEHVTETSVTCQEEGGKMVIIVEDDGVGVPAEMKERIFRHGFGRNTGFGLFLVQEILAITAMSISECGEEGKGARFEITVPSGVWRRG